MNPTTELPKTYAPAEFEDRIYQMWCDRGYFTPDPANPAPAFSVVIPPPNVTGQLHMGHALDETLQDILVRTKRMQGYNTLWVPGTDHAGIATQIKVEERLRVDEGKTRYDLGRGRTPTRHALQGSSKSWVPPAIGRASALPWTMAAPVPCGKCSSISMTRD